MGAFAFMGLGFCVFTWGLQYKLSLYNPLDAASHRIAIAKLLSKKEQSSSAESPMVVRTRTFTKVFYTAPASVFFMVSLMIGVLGGPLSGEWEQRASRLWHLRRAHLRTCFVRPPPFLV
jgi:hypothetical protein